MCRQTRRVIGLVLFFLGCSLAAHGFAQGFLLDEQPGGRRLPRPYHWPVPPRPIPPIPRPTPEPPITYKIRNISVDANLSDQVAKVQVSQTFVNTGSVPMQVSFVFPIPYDGAIDRMTFMVDGKEYDAKMLDAKEARRIYEGYVRQNRDPALLEWIGTGMFRTSVFPVPPGAERVVTLRYTQLCRQSNGVTDFLFPLSTAKFTAAPPESISFRIVVQGQQPIKSIYSPSHAVEIKRPSENQAIVSFTRNNEVPTSDFRLFYDSRRDAVAASVLTFRRDTNDDGYFLLLANPDLRRETESQAAKTVMFVVDRSGSMSGKKIEQARNALKFVLNNLRDGDLFNIVAYDSNVESFRPELQRFNGETRSQALGFVEGLHAGGSTNIDGALQAALKQLVDNSRPNFLIFLTDGLPTIGMVNESKIAENAAKSNTVRARVFTFGVGFDVNSRLLDRLSRQGFGQSEYVRPEEDIEAAVSKLYNRISAPVLADIKLEFEVDGYSTERGPLVNRLYPKDVKDLFAGDQFVGVGRYRQGGAAKIRLSGQLAGKAQSFDYRAELANQSPDDTFAFIEKLWVLRRVGEIIDEIDLHGQNPELVSELLKLATRHGIMTPYTAFLADENVKINELTSNAITLGTNLRALSLESGEAGFIQRRNKAMLQRVEVVVGGAGGVDPTSLDAATQKIPGLRAANQATAPATAPQNIAGAGGQIQKEKDAARPAVLNLGGKTFFYRNKKWVDSSVSEEQLKQARKVAQFSDEYFALLREGGTAANKILAHDEPLIVILNGQAYEIEENSN